MKKKPTITGWEGFKNNEVLPDESIKGQKVLIVTVLEDVERGIIYKQDKIYPNQYRSYYGMMYELEDALKSGFIIHTFNVITLNKDYIVKALNHLT